MQAKFMLVKAFVGLQETKQQNMKIYKQNIATPRNITYITSAAVETSWWNELAKHHMSYMCVDFI